jgi:hypothetical protein
MDEGQCPGLLACPLDCVSRQWCSGSPYLWDQFGASWAVNGQLNMTAYQASTDFLYDTGTFTDAPRINAPDWADPQFVDAVMKEIGVYPNVDDPGRRVP